MPLKLSDHQRSASLKLLLLFAAAMLVVSTPTHAQFYILHGLDAKQGGAGGYGLALNDSGQVAGVSPYPGNGNHATLWNSPSPTDLGTLGGVSSWAWGINRTAQVAGFSETSEKDSTTHAVRWDGTTPTDLGTLGGTSSYAYGINNNGHIAGSSQLAGDDFVHAVRWDGDTPIDLGTLGGTHNSSQGVAINSVGQVAGISYTGGVWDLHATRWDGTTANDLGTLGGATSFGRAINDIGQVAGWSEITGNAETHATLWNGNVPTDLGTLPGGHESEAFGINNAGLVVGLSEFEGSGDVYHATLWRGTVPMDANHLLDADTRNAGWVLLIAYGVNDGGWITGEAKNSITGQHYAYLMSTTVPEPETYCLMVAGLGALVCVALRRKRATGELGL